MNILEHQKKLEEKTLAKSNDLLARYGLDRLYKVFFCTERGEAARDVVEQASATMFSACLPYFESPREAAAGLPKEFILLLTSAAWNIFLLGFEEGRMSNMPAFVVSEDGDQNHGQS